MEYVFSILDRGLVQLPFSPLNRLALERLKAEALLLSQTRQDTLATQVIENRSP